MNDEDKRRAEAWADVVLILRGRVQDAKASGDPVTLETWGSVVEFAEQQKHTAWLKVLSES